jgi:hypothetical protein
VHVFELPRPIYYLPTYLSINFKNNNPKTDFNLDINLTHSNGPLSINQIISHYVSHFVNHYERVKINYPIMLVNPNWLTSLDWQGGFFYTCHFGFFLLENLAKKTMNCNNERSTCWKTWDY